MSTSWSVALAGFNPAERSTLENLIQMAGRTGPTFALALDLSIAKMIIANADDAVVMKRLRAMHPAPRVLLIGGSAGDSGWPIQGRPIKLLSVLDALRRMSEQAATAAAPAQFDATQSFMAPGAGAAPSPPPPDFAQTQPYMAPPPPQQQPDFDKTQPFMRGSTASAATVASQFAKTQTFSIEELRGATGGAPPVAQEEPPEFAKTVAFQTPPSGAGTDFAKTVAFQAMPEGAPAPAPAGARAAPTPMAERGHEAIDEDAMARWRAAHRPPAPPPPTAPPPPAPLPAPEEVGVGADTSSAFLGTLPMQVGPGADRLVQAPTAPKPLGDVLVVDDGDVARAATQRMLNRNGFHADLAGSGAQAVEMARVRAYKFMFIDEISTGGMNALQACRAVREARGAGTRPKMVILSSRGGMIDKLKAKLAGFDAYIVKPVKEDDLLKVLEGK